jgi:hypothetical protein
MVLRYQSGHEIEKGDRVLFRRNPATIELVASDASDPEASWYIQEFGGGVMILDQLSGKTFIDAESIPDYEDLEFVARADSK